MPDNKEFTVEIITPAKSVFTGQVTSLTVPGSAGQFQVLLNHAPLMSTFEIGLLKLVAADGTSEEYTTAGGVVDVRSNKVLVLADSLERVDQIDRNRAERAAERAKARLSDKADKSVDFGRAEIALAKALNRLKSAKN